jgi:cell division protein FtsL
MAASTNAGKMTKITLYLIIAFVLTLAGTAVAVIPKMLANNSKTEELNSLQEQIDERSKQLQDTLDF